MRILLIILQFPPDVNSTGLLLSQLCNGLIERGNQVSVITTFPHYEHFRVWPQYRRKLAQKSKFGKMDVLRLYVHARGRKQQMWYRFLSYISFNVLALFAGLLSRQRFDVILCTNGGFFSGATASLIGRIRRAPFVMNIQDLYPETPIRTGQLKNRRLITALRYLERYMCTQAAHIAVIAPYFRDHLLSIGIPEHKISVIPNFVDTDFIRPLARDNPFSRQHRLVSKFVVCHAGNVGYAYDLETMVDAAALLREHDDIVFLIVGDGVVRPMLEEQATRLGLANVRFMPFQQFESLPLLRASCDVQVSLNRPGSSTHSLPSKVYEIMASGRPLLASADRGSDLWNLVEQTGCGIVVEPTDARALADAVLRLRHSPDERQVMGERGRAVAQSHYSRASVVAQYEEILRRVVAGDDGALLGDQTPRRVAVAAQDTI